MQLHQLRALAAISDAKSFTTAARQLEMSQSSLSHPLPVWRELGLRLFERGRRGAQVTDVGRRVLMHVRRVQLCLDANPCDDSHRRARARRGNVR